jgi:hypothetical protein
LANLREDPLKLKALEEIQILHTHTAVGAEVNYAMLGLMIQDIPQPAGNVYTIRGTGAATLTANAWTNIGTITWTNNLPNGVYAIVGGTFFSATCLAGRFAIEGFPWRPGGLGLQALGNQTDTLFRYGRLGVWGTFHNYAMPQCEFFATAADTSEEVTMDIVKIG